MTTAKIFALAPTDPTPNPVAAPGSEQWVVPQNPFSSTAMWGLAVLLITAAVKRWVPSQFQSAAVPAALEATTTAIGGLLVLYGRWTANRPLGFSNRTTKVVVKLLPLLFAFALMFTSIGCSQFVPNTFPILPPGQVPTAADIVLETNSTNAMRNDLLLADIAVDTAFPADAAVADALENVADADLTTYDTDYAEGIAPTEDEITIVKQILAEIRNIKSQHDAPAGQAAIAHGKSILASQKQGIHRTN